MTTDREQWAKLVGFRDSAHPFEPRTIAVPLPGDVADALITVSLANWRHPKQQAAAFIIEALKRLGELPDRPSPATTATATSGDALGVAPAELIGQGGESDGERT